MVDAIRVFRGGPSAQGVKQLDARLEVNLSVTVLDGSTGHSAVQFGRLLAAPCSLPSITWLNLRRA